MSGLSIFGIILLVIGMVLFFIQRHQGGRLKSLQRARRATIAELQQIAKAVASEIGGGSWQDYVKVSGLIRCDRPLLSELKQQPCVYYTMSVTREYEETVTREDSDGNSRQETNRGSETVSSHQQSIPFYLEDPTGRIEVNPDDAGIETIEVLNEFRSETAIGGTISFGGFSLAFGSSSDNRRTLGYRYQESLLPLDRRALVVGMVSDRQGDLVIQKPDQSEHRFMISLKDEATLAKNAKRNAQIALYSMMACLGLGMILFVVGFLKR